ncbi:sulfurtransferase [Aeromicrobium sp. IC_218]|uniref:sulfurtransferase n=1 Tax=Aeromicrobium sp. IC_218 TaxID=2545468 RepID=UPI00103A3C61|nr:sulfurtransferase [Aeromicrobium sp. IC_218]TCJ00692.1 sulfurtransferase [Aeromicrobium sp. IC_218]
MSPTDRSPALVDATWLAAHLGDPRVIVLEAVVGTLPPADRRVPGARRADLDGSLSDPASDLPHTRPDAERLGVAVRDLGVDAAHHVVVYDAHSVYASARVRWMLTTAGHAHVSVLDGGLPAWLDAGLPTEPADAPQESVAPGDFVPRAADGVVVDADGVQAVLDSGAAVLVDARSTGRFAGRDPEPRPGLRGGHVPGSVNLPFTDLLDDGRLRPVDALRAALDAVAGPDVPVVVSCGSGVTACVVGLAAELTGRPYRVYDGSWADWGRPGIRPVETGDA